MALELPVLNAPKTSGPHAEVSHAGDDGTGVGRPLGKALGRALGETEGSGVGAADGSGVGADERGADAPAEINRVVAPSMSVDSGAHE